MQQRRKAVETTEAGGLYRPDDGAVFDVDNGVIDLTGRRRRQTGKTAAGRTDAKGAGNEHDGLESDRVLDLGQVERVIPPADPTVPKRNLSDRKLGQAETGGLLRRFRRY